MLGLEAAERATRSREVDLSRLKGFHLRFAPKMWSGVTCNWCLSFSPASIERANLFTLYLSEYEERF